MYNLLRSFFIFRRLAPMSKVFNLKDKSGTIALSSFVMIACLVDVGSVIDCKILGQLFACCKEYKKPNLNEIVGVLEFETWIDCLIVEWELGFDSMSPILEDLFDRGLEVKNYAIAVIPKNDTYIIPPNYTDLAKDVKDFDSDKTNRGFRAVLVVFGNQIFVEHPSAAVVLEAILLK
jgi:hypothetical protein